MKNKMIPLNLIKLDPNQPRKIIDGKSISNLAKSLKTEGLIHPIEVDSNYRVIVGELRYRAAKSLGWKEIRATVNTEKLTPYIKLRRQMAENLQQSGAKGGGQPMNAIDTAKAWAQLYKLKFGKDYSPGELSHQEIYGKIKPIVEEVGVPYETVWQHLKLLEQPSYVVESMTRKKKPIPRTFYREAERATEKWQEPLKQAIASGKIINREDVTRFARVTRTKPEKAEIELLRITQRQSQDANRILNRAVELGLALKNSDPSKFSKADREMVHLQLNSITGGIRTFIGRLKKTKELES